MFDSRSALGFLVHTPCGPRKSGMPDSVEMPAPVSTTIAFASRSQLAMSSRWDTCAVLRACERRRSSGEARLVRGVPVALPGPARRVVADRRMEARRVQHPLDVV